MACSGGAARWRDSSIPPTTMRPASAGSSPMSVTEQDRFARAALADDRDQLARFDGQVETPRSTACSP
jgi:hypothetical protein